MSLRVCTVLSAREWEPAFVEYARRTAAVRLVMRAYQAEDIESQADVIDVVVAGAEVAWVTAPQIAAWRRKGLAVVGVYPRGDRPARSLLETAGADEVFSDDTPTPIIVQAVRLLRPTAPGGEHRTGTLVAVTGPRGAPGRTEVALGLALNWSRRRTVLLDLDREAPGLAIRLGLDPRPDLTDAADAVRGDEGLAAATQRVGELAVVVGSHRPGDAPLRTALVEDVVEAARGAFEIVMADLGPCPSDDPILKQADHAVLVAHASATGIVRAAAAVAGWAGPPPALVLNRATRGARGQTVEAAQKWTGLDPVAVLPERAAVRADADAARLPGRALRRSLRVLTVPP